MHSQSGGVEAERAGRGPNDAGNPNGLGWNIDCRHQNKKCKHSGKGASGHCPRRHGQRNGARTSCPLWASNVHRSPRVVESHPKRTGCPRAGGSARMRPPGNILMDFAGHLLCFVVKSRLKESESRNQHSTVRVCWFRGLFRRNGLWNWQWQLRDRLRWRTGRLFNDPHSMPMFGALPPYPSNSWSAPLAQNPETRNQLQSPSGCKSP
jgi:hypothetical protein